MARQESAPTATNPRAWRVAAAADRARGPQTVLDEVVIEKADCRQTLLNRRVGEA
jgi:hypothetical protein